MRGLVTVFTAVGNMKAVPRRKLVEWVIELWKAVSNEIIIYSFKHCALNLKADGSEDDAIHCFREGKPCASGSRILKNQMMCWMTVHYKITLSSTESDVEDADHPYNLVDDDDDDFVLDIL